MGDFSLCRRASYAEFFHFLDKRGLGVARRLLGETLDGCNLVRQQFFADRNFWQREKSFLSFLVIAALDIDTQESVKLDCLAVGYEMLLTCRRLNVDSSLFNLGVGHL